jgi:hypothetical protein
LTSLSDAESLADSPESNHRPASSFGVMKAAADSPHSASDDFPHNADSSEHPQVHVPAYFEPATVSASLFNRFDINRRGFFGLSELAMVLRPLGLQPSRTELAELLDEAGASGTPLRLSKARFLELRTLPDCRPELRGRDSPELAVNIIGDFLKLASSPSGMRPFAVLTAESILNALEAEGAPPAYTAGVIAEIMSLDNKDSSTGFVSFRQFAELRLRRIPASWLDWLAENVARGVSAENLAAVMLEHGFTIPQCRSLIAATRDFGRLVQKHSWVDNSRRGTPGVRAYTGIS